MLTGVTSFLLVLCPPSGGQSPPEEVLVSFSLIIMRDIGTNVLMNLVCTPSPSPWATWGIRQHAPPGPTAGPDISPHNMTHSGGAPLNAMATVRLGHTTPGVGTAARDPLARAGRTRDCGMTAMPLPARIKARADSKESAKMSCHGCKRSLAKTSRTALPRPRFGENQSTAMIPMRDSNG